MRPGCCSESRLANVHQGFGEHDRRVSREWTTDEAIRYAFTSPRYWLQALVGFGTVFLVIVAILSAGVDIH